MAGRRGVGFLGQVWEPEGRDRVSRGTGRFEVGEGRRCKTTPSRELGGVFFVKLSHKRGILRFEAGSWAAPPLGEKKARLGEACRRRGMRGAN